MNTPRGAIQLNELQFILMKDRRYGQNVELHLKNILEQRKHDPSFLSFSDRFALLPCKKDRHRLLLYFWIKFGLPGYFEKQQIDRRFWRKRSPDFWLIDFDIDIDELEQFLVKHGYPLPSELYPDAEHAISKDDLSRKANTNSRNKDLQQEAERLANEYIDLGLGYLSKREIAKKLFNSSKQKWGISQSTIERIIRKTW